MLNLDNEVVGTGVIVSSDGVVATCAHVLYDALGVVPGEAGDRELALQYPALAAGADDDLRRARLQNHFVDYDDDVVLVRPIQAPPALAPDRIAALGPAALDSDDHQFSAYGYRQIGDMTGMLSKGEIRGHCDSPDGQRLLVEPVQLSSAEIGPGMSGAGVLDKTRGLVIGLITEMNVAGPDLKDRDTAFAVDAAAIGELGIPLHADRPFGREPEARPEIALVPGPPAVPVRFHAAPAPPETWVPRAQLDALRLDGQDPDVAVSVLVGVSGSGKTVIARRWLDDLTVAEPATRALWWTFGDEPEAHALLDEALRHLGEGVVQMARLGSSLARRLALDAVLAAEPCIIVLDGLTADHLREKELACLVETLAQADRSARVVVTCEVPLPGFGPQVRHHAVEPIDARGAARYLEIVAPGIPAARRDEIAARAGGLPLVLTLLAALETEGLGA